ncbi:hypothetical protein KV697_06515 [Sphingomonas sanguinis]|uniref:Lipoprotein n=1 Tax=Sphingomonas sanguinis TaxID=33051 RepID=A0ABU5LTV4_9SPHN|nr:hypothetical protein [Sphingomonas sanguinis]MDZ7283364.1 hypothetical protein [Sphingomonas sanguinis]QXT36946.1 hypothetical protein KV697_06515 [Sphingomonas sanguinis]
MSKFIVLLASVAATISSNILAADREGADPETYISAFNDVCRTHFPDLDAVARDAVAKGWQSSKMRLIEGATDLPKNLPQAFHKDSMMLFLTRPESGDFSEVCQISGSEATKLTGADIAAMMAPSVDAAASMVDKGADHETTTWRTGPGISVQAGISIYRKFRTISLSARHTR